MPLKIACFVPIARDESRGKEAVAKLEGEGLHPKFHQLDIDDQTSIERLRDFLLEKYGGLDILVNNAGIAYKVSRLMLFDKSVQLSESTHVYYDTEV